MSSESKGARVVKNTTALLAALLMLLPVTVMAADASSQSATVNIEMNSVSVKDAIDALFRGRDAKYFIEPGVTGKIAELKLKGITFEQALTALTDATDLAFTVRDGSYVIAPKARLEARAQEERAAAAQTQAQQVTAPEGQQPQGAAQSQPSVLNVTQNQGAPVFYGHPGGYGGFGPGPYGFNGPVYPIGDGNVRVLGGWPPVVVAGGNPSVIGFGMNPPPPPGWVGPDVLRFLRSQYAIRSRVMWMPSYGW